MNTNKPDEPPRPIKCDHCGAWLCPRCKEPLLDGATCIPCKNREANDGHKN